MFAPSTTANDKAEFVKCIAAVAKNTSVRATAAPAPGTTGPNPVDGHNNAVPIVPVKSKDASTEALAGAWYVGTSSQNVAPNGFYSLLAGPCPSGYNAISCGCNINYALQLVQIGPDPYPTYGTADYCFCQWYLPSSFGEANGVVGKAFVYCA